MKQAINPYNFDHATVMQIIINEACKVIQEVHNWKPAALAPSEGENVDRLTSLNEAPPFLNSPSTSLKVPFGFNAIGFQ